MAFYPRARKQRRRLMTRDLTVGVFVVFSAWFAHIIYSVVQSLSSISGAITEAGTGLQQLLNGLAAAIGAIPFIGSGLADSIRTASQGTGGNLVNRGQSLGDSIHQAALIFGFATFAVPMLILATLWAPNRLAQFRELQASSVALDQTSDDIEQVLALRAITRLPFATLMKYSQDPLGDFARGNFSSLAQAARDDAGI